MTRATQNYSRQVSLLEGLLREQYWIESESKKGLRFFRPPPSVGFPPSFSIALPVDPSQSGSGALLTQAVNVLREVYGSELDVVDSLLAEQPDLQGPALIGIRFVDASTRNGSIPLGALSSFLHHAEKGLEGLAKFKLSGVSHGDSEADAQQFVESCRFLQTTQGSFIARIEVPFMELRQSDLFDGAGLTSNDIVFALQASFGFLSESVLQGESNLESLVQAPEVVRYFDPELLGSMTRMIVDSKVQQIDVDTRIGLQRRSASTGILSAEAVSRLKNFSSLVGDLFYGEEDFEMEGAVIELRSRDPQGDRNHVRIVGEFRGDKTYVSANLNNMLYGIAVDAHQQKRKVRIRGSAVRLKTQVRVNRVAGFEFVVGKRGIE